MNSFAPNALWKVVFKSKIKNGKNIWAIWHIVNNNKILNMAAKIKNSLKKF